MSDLADQLAATPVAPYEQRQRPEHPNGMSYEWDGNAGFIQTGPLGERPKTWDEFLLDAGLDPDEVDVQEPVQVRGWDSPVGDGNVMRMHYYRLTVTRRRSRVDLEDLIKAAKKGQRAAPTAPVADEAFLVALGDLQLGKMDGDGVEGTVARFVASTQAAAERYRLLRRKHGAMPIYLFHLGDCIEGYMSQGGANAWRTTLTTTEQVRLYRRLVLEQVKTFAPLTPQLVVAGVPGNHDEAHRPLHTYGDSWAIDAVSAVRDALELAGGYENVTMLAPARDELTLTLDICGTIVSAAHGHQFGSGAESWKKWWQGQQHGRQDPGDADLLLAGHLHHLRLIQNGQRTFLQVPALESGSQWYKHRAGEWGSPGIVTMRVGGGSWAGMEVHSA